MVPLDAFICVLELLGQRKKFSIRKTYVFFSFTQIYILQQCLDPNPHLNPYPNPIFSDSDPAKTYVFFRNRIHNTAFPVPYAHYKRLNVFLGLGESLVRPAVHSSPVPINSEGTILILRDTVNT
jgi:hypothetical protein